jgi:hypothetical protein
MDGVYKMDTWNCLHPWHRAPAVEGIMLRVLLSMYGLYLG